MRVESPNTRNNAKPILLRLELALDWNFDLLPTEKVTEIVEKLLDKAQFNETRNQTISAPLYKLTHIFYIGIMIGDLGIHIGGYQP